MIKETEQPMKCNHCKKETKMTLISKTFSNGIVHLLRHCPHCGGFNNYHPQEIDPLTNCHWKMPFGKHKGEKLSAIPDDYLGWCIENFEKKMRDRFLIEAKRRGMNILGWEDNSK